MGFFNTFIDKERGRESQSKAFDSITMNPYVHESDSSDMVESLENHRTYYIETSTDGYYIRVEGNLFTGIVSFNEDNVLDYPLYDYQGRRIDISIFYTDELVEVSHLVEYDEILKKYGHHLPMNKIRANNKRLQTHVDTYLSGKKLSHSSNLKTLNVQDMIVQDTTISPMDFSNTPKE